MGPLDAALPYPGGLLRLRAEDGRIADRIRERLGNLLVEPRQCTGEILFVPGEIPDPAWDDDLKGRVEGTRIVSELSGGPGQYDLATGRGRFEIAVQIDWFEIYIENVIRIVLVELGARDGRWICHTAALADPELRGAYLFFGVSGSGKTTTTEMSAAVGYKPINDDLVFLSEEEGQVWAWSCPFHGTTKIRQFVQGRIPVKGLFRLQKAEMNEAIPLSPATAVRELMGSLVTWRPRSRAEQDRLFAAADSICRKVPVFRLKFRKEPTFWEAVHDGLQRLHDGTRRGPDLLAQGR